MAPGDALADHEEVVFVHGQTCWNGGERLDPFGSAVIDGTEDEDVQSEDRNDLAQLEMARERIESAACAEFGPVVRVFSRERVGVAPRL